MGIKPSLWNWGRLSEEVTLKLRLQKCELKGSGWSRHCYQFNLPEICLKSLQFPISWLPTAYRVKCSLLSFAFILSMIRHQLIIPFTSCTLPLKMQSSKSGIPPQIPWSQSYFPASISWLICFTHPESQESTCYVSFNAQLKWHLFYKLSIHGSLLLPSHSNSSVPLKREVLYLNSHRYQDPLLTFTTLSPRSLKQFDLPKHFFYECQPCAQQSAISKCLKERW